MNAENFTDYLENPAKLYQIPYQELKSLVYQYPYCQNLRYLLLKKSKLENHKDFEKNLQLAATCSLDRGFLFQQLEQVQPLQEGQDSYLIKEDYLELKDLNVKNTDRDATDEKIMLPPISVVFEEQEMLDLQETSNNKIPPTTEVEEPEAEHQPDPQPPFTTTSTEEVEEAKADIDAAIEELFNFDHEEPAPIKEKKEEINENVEELSLPVKDQKPEFQVVEGTMWDMFLHQFSNGALIQEPYAKMAIKVITAGLKSIDYLLVNRLQKEKLVSPHQSEKQKLTTGQKGHKARTEIPSPVPKASFSSWLKQFQSPQLSIREQVDLEKGGQDKNERKPSEKKRKSKKQRIKTIARSSITENEEIVTETLAKILVRQENYAKALHMYRRLSEIFPDKKEEYEKIIDDLEKMI